MNFLIKRVNLIQFQRTKVDILKVHRMARPLVFFNHDILIKKII